MTQEEFEQHKRDWAKEWLMMWKWQSTVMDFEQYMLKKGIHPDEYKKLNESIGLKWDEYGNPSPIIDDEK
jgi:hypothetical protein